MLVAGGLTLLLVLGSGEPAVSQDAASLYKEAARLRNSGDLAGAAQAYGRAHELLRAADPDHSNVLDSLLESVDLSLAAHAQRPDALLLCDTERLIAEFETLAAGRGSSSVAEVEERRGRVSATIARDGVSCRAAEVAPMEPAASTPAPTPAAAAVDSSSQEALVNAPTNVPKAVVPEGPQMPAPRPTRAPLERRSRGYRIGGYTSLGLASVGLVLLGIGAGLGAVFESSGAEQAMKGPSASWLQENMVTSGNVANALVLGGAVMATTATVTTVALLATARRKSRAALRSRLDAGGLRF